MTTDDLRDWHARRAGWVHVQTERGDYAWRHATLLSDPCSNWGHPFPATLDAADASFPKGWEWGRTPPRGDWCAVSLARGITEQTAYTGDKVHDMYELSKLAWEQEAA